MSKKFLSGMAVCVFCLFVSGFLAHPVFAANGEFEPDANTLFLAHYNTSLDADYSQGAPKRDPLDSGYLTQKNGGYFGEGLVGRVGTEALKEAGADIKVSSLIPVKAFDGIRYASPGNIDLVKGTFECWYKPYFSIPRAKDMPEGWPMSYMIFAYRESATAYLSFGINSYGAPGAGTGVFFFFATKEGGAVCPGYAITWQPGTWHHVAITWETVPEPGKMALFIDGQLVSSQPMSALKKGFLTQGDIPYFCVGSNVWRGSGNPMQYGKSDGVIDEVRISNNVRYTENFKLPVKPAAAPK